MFLTEDGLERCFLFEMKQREKLRNNAFSTSMPPLLLKKMSKMSGKGREVLDEEIYLLVNRSVH